MEPLNYNMLQGADNVAIRRLRVCTRYWPAASPRRAFGLVAIVLTLSLFAFGCTKVHTANFAAGTAALTVNLEGFRNDRGVALVSLFAGTSGFPDKVDASVATVSASVVSGRATATFVNVPFGEYAVSVLHDEDGNGKMATGLFGVPREGFGFSGYPDYRFGHPDFSEVSFLLVEPQREMTIGVRYETGRRRHQDDGRASESRRPQE